MTDTPDDPQVPEENQGDSGYFGPTISIADEMKTSYLDYAMSVIVSRAIPDLRDGLKPWIVEPGFQRVFNNIPDQWLVCAKRSDAASQPPVDGQRDKTGRMSLQRCVKTFVVRFGPITAPQANPQCLARGVQ